MRSALLALFLLAAPALAAGARQCAAGDVDQLIWNGTLDTFWNWTDGYVATWVSLQAMSADGFLLHIGSGATDDSVEIEWENAAADLTMRLVDNTSTVAGHNITTLSEDSSWHHVALAWSSDQNYVKTYVDGAVVDSETYPPVTLSGALSVRRLCSTGAGASPISATFAHVQLFFGIVSGLAIDGEIQRIMRCPNSGSRSPGSRAWYPMWEDGTGAPKDLQGKVVVGTVTNTPTGVGNGPPLARWCGSVP